MSIEVTVSRFYTRNLGNFENVKIGYELTTDEIHDSETVEEFKDRLKAKVDKWVREDIREIDSRRNVGG